MLVKMTTVVNFANILQAAYALIPFCQKIKYPTSKHIKAAQNTFVLKSCSYNVGEIDYRTRCCRQRWANSTDGSSEASNKVPGLEI